MSQQAYNYLIKILSARDYSEYKLREKLKAKKFPANEIDTAIEKIKTNGYLQEKNYTEARIKAFMNKGYSVHYIRQKMAQEKLVVENDLIHDVFLEHKTDEAQQIERLARKKISTKESLTSLEEAKILRFLISKGHAYSLSKKILTSILQNETPFE